MITIITGPMFSGKSKKLIDIYERNAKLGYKQICFKPFLDTRDGNTIHSRDSKQMLEAKLIESLYELEDYNFDDIECIYIDEAQFLQGDINILFKLSALGKSIFISGLYAISEQEYFPIMAAIMAIANNIIILKAKCSKCGEEASFSHYKLGNKSGDYLIGNSNEYEALCEKCLYKES